MYKNTDKHHYFKNRDDAAVQMIDTLPLEMFTENETVVIGVSEGGVYFADKIAQKIDARMDILLTEAVFAPNNPELPIAMISETDEVVIHKALVEAFDISEDYIYSEAQRKYEDEVLAYVYKYRKGSDMVSLEGKYVILSDECIETGLTMTVALKSVIARGAKNIYIATPILDKVVYETLLALCDGVFCPYKIQDYILAEYYYENFESLPFEEIIKIVDKYKEKKINPMKDSQTDAKTPQ